MTFSIDRYLNVKQAYMPSFSSDGRRVAFLCDITGVPQVWRVGLGAAALSIDPVVPMPEQLTFAEDRVLWLRQSPAPDDDRILFTRDRGGDENAHLYLLDPAAGIEICLTAGHDGVMHLPGQWSPDGRTILFAANRADPNRFGIYRQALDEPEARLLWQSDEPGYLFHLSANPATGRILFARHGRSAAHDLLELDPATGETRQLSPADRPARYHHAAYSADGCHAYTVTDLDSDMMNVARVDLDSGRWETVVGPLWEIEYFALASDGRHIAFTINQAGYSRLELLDLVNGAARPGPALPDGVLGRLDERLAFSADSHVLAFSYSTPTRTTNIYVWDWAAMGDSVRPVTRMSHGGIPLETFAEGTLVHYPTFDNREIPAWLYRPKDASGPLPVVVQVHGGPEYQTRPWFDFLTQYLVNRGYAVLAPNVRGSTGYGNAYGHLDDRDKRLDSVADLAHAARWLKTQPDFDGERIAVLGGSYGGYMVLAALAFHPDLWAAGIDVVGISDFVTFLENTSGYRRQHRESEYGSLAADRELLASLSPIHYVERMTAPLLVIHGANDPRVPLSEAEQLVSRLRELGRAVELLVFDDEGHGIGKLKNKQVAYPAIARFLHNVLRVRPTF